MRKLKKRFLAGSLFGSVAGFLFAFVNDVTFRDPEAESGKKYEVDPKGWVVWTVIGGVSGGALALLRSFARRHPKLTATITIGWVLFERRTGLNAAVGGRPDWDIHHRQDGWGR